MNNGRALQHFLSSAYLGSMLHAFSRLKDHLAIYEGISSMIVDKILNYTDAAGSTRPVLISFLSSPFISLFSLPRLAYPPPLSLEHAPARTLVARYSTLHHLPPLIVSYPP